MKKAVLICVGRLKTSYWQEACEHYLKLLRNWRRIECIETRDSPPALPAEARVEKESAQILARLASGYYAIALHDTGRQFSSRQFAELLNQCDTRHIKTPAFIIGGPFGLSQKVLEACHISLSLSPMTWTHELSKVLLLEQLYRAESILRGTPYHH